jgi:predicted nucleic acid-binding protein
MKPFFADTFYFLALGDRKDAGHEAAMRYSASSPPLVTSAWVLVEVADALSTRELRARFVDLYMAVRADRRTRIIGPGSSILNPAIALYSSRTDKDWSLTDCTSFVIMERLSLTSALTGDRHFEQAGFRALLR